MGIPQREPNNIASFSAYNNMDDSHLANMSLYTKQKHRDSLLEILYIRKKVLHIDLAKELKISASGLNAVLKKISDVDDPPVKSTKVGKYKYYSLTATGKRFVEEVLMPPDQRLDLEHLREVLDIFQSQTGDTWEERFNSLFYLAGRPAEERDDEIESAFCEFVSTLCEFYKKNPGTATAFIEELIASVAVRDKILAYLTNIAGTGQKLMVLNNILDKDDEKAYGLLDDLYELSIVKNELLKAENYDVTAIDEFTDAIQEIKSTVLHALVVGEEKDVLREEWIKQGLERQLAFYAAEKYRILASEIGKRYKEG